MMHYRISDIADEINVKEKDPANSGFDKFVGLEHYVSGDIEIKSFGDTSNLVSAMKVFQSGDVLVARRNVYLKRASVVKFDGLTSGDSIVLRAKTDVMSKLLPFILNTDAFWDFAEQYSDGTMSKRLSPKLLMEYEFDLPDEDKQLEFAEMLWAAHETKEAYKDLLDKTDELVKSQFIEMFGGVTDTKPLADLAEMVTVGIANSATHAYVSDGVLMFRNQNIKANELDDSDLIYIKPEFAKKYESKTLKANDILVARTGYPGTACIVPEKYAGSQTFTTLIARMKQSSDLLPVFVCRYINSPSGQAYVKENEAGSAQLNFGATALSKMPIILPPMGLQERYLAFAEQSDKSKFELKKAIENINELIRSLMQQDFSN